MKKIFAIMLAMFALVMVSCGGDEPIPIGNDQVVGTWVPASAATPGLIDDSKMIDHITLTENGTYTEVLLDSDGNEKSLTAAYAVYDNGYILMTIGDDIYRKVKYEVGAGTLTLEGKSFKKSAVN